MVTIKIAGREIGLAFTLDAMDALERLQDKGEPLDMTMLAEAVKDRHQLLDVCAVLANAGGSCDVDAAWLSARVRPGQLPKLTVAVLNAISEGMRMELDDGDEDEEVDVVLEDLRKKGETAT
jgi:hypothetical protein